MSRSTISIVPFSKSRHERKGFDCGNESLNRYLEKHISADIRRNLARGYVAVDDSAPDKVIGYVTLATHSLTTDLLPDSGKLPYSEIPSALIGRIAVDILYQGRGVGGKLIGYAIKTTLAISEEIGMRLLVTHPIDEDTASWYERFGFKELRPGVMALPFGTAQMGMVMGA